MAGEKKYSYIKKAYAKNGWYAFGLSIVSLALLSAALFVTLLLNGEGGLVTGALGLSSIVMALMSLWFFFLSLKEADCNRLFSEIGAVLSALLLLIWASVLSSGIA